MGMSLIRETQGEITKMSLKEYWDSIPDSLYKFLRQSNLEKVKEYIVKGEKLTIEQSNLLFRLLDGKTMNLTCGASLECVEQIVLERAFEFENVEFLERLFRLVSNEKIRNILVEMGADKDCGEKERKRLIENSMFNK